MEQDPFTNETQPGQLVATLPVKWMLYILISAIPLVGLVMLFVRGFGNDGNAPL